MYYFAIGIMVGILYTIILYPTISSRVHLSLVGISIYILIFTVILILLWPLVLVYTLLIIVYSYTLTYSDTNNILEYIFILIDVITYWVLMLLFLLSIMAVPGIIVITAITLMLHFIPH